MANSALIDDLLKQFAENPRRVFARLANEYRKRGELDSAIEICRSHVPLQPGYRSGHIVLGQALYDRGSLEDARVTFETALTLDPENLIALRHMGDIARANGDIDGARRWYRQLLEIDPQNEEVAAQIETLGAADHAAGSADADESDVLGGWGEVTPEAIELTIEEETVADDPSTLAGRAPDAVANDAAAAAADDALALEEVFDLPVSALEGVAEEAPVVAAVEGFETTSFESVDESREAALDPVALDDLSIPAGEAVESLDEATTAVSGPGAVAPLFPAETLDFADDGAVDEGANTFATETMAELYLQQGFPDRALAIYRELAARNPEDSSLLERIAELTDADEAVPAPVTATGARTAREFFGVLAYRRAPRAAVAEPDSADDSLVATEETFEREGAALAPDASEEASSAIESAAAPAPGIEIRTAEEPSDSVDDSVAGDIAEPAPVESSDRPIDYSRVEQPSASAEARNGKPGREADSALSLDDVFRDSPVVEGSGPRNALSFDEFFARRGNGSGEHAGGTVATGTNGSSPSEEHASDDEPQDLELFHAWLDGLKG
jgi:tetratricopeptide (TPR) repeat protein